MVVQTDDEKEIAKLLSPMHVFWKTPEGFENLYRFAVEHSIKELTPECRLKWEIVTPGKITTADKKFSIQYRQIGAAERFSAWYDDSLVGCYLTLGDAKIVLEQFSRDLVAMGFNFASS